MDGWLSFASIMLRIEIGNIIVWVVCRPNRRCSFPSNIKAISLAEINRDLEWLANYVGFGDRVDDTGTKLRNALGAGVALMRRDRRP
jgi:hypothetical protein